MVFIFRAHFRGRKAHGGIVENGIIAEAVFPSRLPQQFAMDLAPGLDHLALRGNEGDHANELGLALTVRHMLRIFQQQKESAPIVQRVVKAIACGVNARFTVQCIHCNTAVVRQSRQTI